MTDNDLQELIARRTVVVFRSRVTDTRALSARLTARGIDFEELEMPMGDAAMRARFDALREQTGWTTLPQIFVDGRFVGGETEFLQHPLLAHPEYSQRAPWAKLLGYAGVLPFLAGVLAMQIAAEAPEFERAARATLVYGAVILSFVGAVHWGSAMFRPARMPSVIYLAGVLPALIGWVTTIIPLAWGFAVQTAAILGVYTYERLVAGELSFPLWYRRLRGHLTGAVAVLLGAAWASTAFGSW